MDLLKALQKKDSRTWNNAISNSTTGDKVLDYFSKVGSYRERAYEEIKPDLTSAFGESPELTLSTIFYNRLITRKIEGFRGQKTNDIQYGQGNRSEFRLSLVWLAETHPEILKLNLWMVPIVGTWKDLWHIDVLKFFEENNFWDTIYSIMKEGLNSKSYLSELLKKYMPTIRSKKYIENLKTPEKKKYRETLNKFAKGFSDYMGWNSNNYYQEYRNVKSSGDAHIFQKKISKNQINEIDFENLPGIFLNWAAVHIGKDHQTFLKRHCLEQKFMEWLDTKPTIPFNGYSYELAKKLGKNRSLIARHTIDKQFENLLAKAKKLDKKIIVLMDTSGSMESYITEDIRAIDVCLGLGIYFASLIEGHFHNHVMMFDNNSKMKRLTGKTFSERYDEIVNDSIAWGSTNFQSAIDELVRVKKTGDIDPSEFEDLVILAISDMQFNPVTTRGHYWNGEYENTNHEESLKKFDEAGIPRPLFVWWQVNGRFTEDVPSTMGDQGTMLLSGFDGSILSLLLSEEVEENKNKPMNEIDPFEKMVQALSQEIFGYLRIS